MKRLSTNTKRTPAYLTSIFTLLAIFGMTAMTQHAKAQSAYKVAEGSQVVVAGSSNLHDWTMTATSFSCEASVAIKGDQVSDITALSTTIPVTNLKSKDKSMDSRAYKTLNSDTYKNITFKLTDATVAGKVIKATGNLTISGVTVPVTITSTYTVAGGVITIKGAEKIKFSQFKIKAPSFMFGALKVTDDLTIDILLKLKG